ncbi:MAG: hypothetical protein IVW57_04425 [Ktedonobacterales bacterium]|nr:hypothetical protein [Ktedonobacterales bacterium]
MRAVLALLLVATGLGVIYTGMTGHLPGKPAASSDPSANRNPFNGAGGYQGTKPNLQGAATATARAQAQANPWAQAAANGVAGAFQSGTQGGGAPK